MLQIHKFKDATRYYHHMGIQNQSDEVTYYSIDILYDGFFSCIRMQKQHKDHKNI